MSDFDFLLWLKQNVPGGRVTAGGWYTARCPFHADSRPSFGVNVSHGGYRCMSASCGEHGGIVRLISKVEGITYAEAAKLAGINSPKPWDIDGPVEESEPEKPKRPQSNPLPEDLVAVSGKRFPTYLRLRGYNLDDALAWGLRFGDIHSAEWSGYLVFPYWNEVGTYVTFSGRLMGDGPGSRYRHPEQGLASTVLYGAWRVSQLESVERLFVAEGPFDVMRLWKLGQVAVGLSTARASSEQLLSVKGMAHRFSCPVCVLLDQGDDEAQEARKITEMLSLHQVGAYVGVLPCKDPDKLTDETLLATLDNCKEQEVCSTPSVGEPDG